eukprot:TRINITY_DN23351_c0_g1_i1.p1 TRINITY_DN23351_c0_g1~~TRINITY_DN23351_c0_g1_i1.p1  ORF type:complete len:1222 (-),score=301.90 TRINITY_DN23351_c0_g1_i1:121-3765(-)
MAEVSNWPSGRELENWLQGCAADTDEGALALRKMLQTNPGCHVHLTGDDVLSGLIQLFAKRFRTKIMASENPIQQSTLYRPLCELVWRIVGLVIHSISEFGGGDHSSGAPAELGSPVAASFTIPKNAQGQLRMLLKTNEDLSFKFNEARRAYLRELSQHRDKQRRLGRDAIQRLEFLREQPVMFYEPLESILDERTKDFVREVVEERIKLEMKTDFKAIEVEDEKEKLIALLQEQLHQKEEELAEMKQEETKLKSRVEREAELKTRHEEGSQKWKAEAQRLQLELESRVAEVHVAPVVEPVTQSQYVEADTNLKDNLKAREEELCGLQEDAKQLTAQLEDQDRLLAEMRQKLKDMSAAAEDAERRIAAEAERSTKLQFQVDKLQKDGDAAKKATKSKGHPLPDQQSDSNAAAAAEAAAAEAVAKSEDLERRLAAEQKKVREEQERFQAAEKELREAKETTERALREAERRAKEAERRAKAPAEAVPDAKPSSPKAAVISQESDTSNSKEIAKLEKWLAQKDLEIERLEALLKEASGKPAPPREEPKIQKVRSKADSEPRAEAERARDEAERKLREAEEKMAEQEDEIAKQNAKIVHLLKKLRELGGDGVMAELEQWEASLPASWRKKLVYERLWDDAQRRLAELRIRESNLFMTQRSLVESALQSAKTNGAKEYVMRLASLQATIASTTKEFKDALFQFHDLNQAPGGGGGGCGDPNSNKISQVFLELNVRSPREPQGSELLEEEDLKELRRKQRSMSDNVSGGRIGKVPPSPGGHHPTCSQEHPAKQSSFGNANAGRSTKLPSSPGTLSAANSYEHSERSVRSPVSPGYSGANKHTAEGHVQGDTASKASSMVDVFSQTALHEISERSEIAPAFSDKDRQSAGQLMQAAGSPIGESGASVAAAAVKRLVANNPSVVASLVSEWAHRDESTKRREISATTKELLHDLGVGASAEIQPTQVNDMKSGSGSVLRKSRRPNAGFIEDSSLHVMSLGSPAGANLGASGEFAANSNKLALKASASTSSLKPLTTSKSDQAAERLSPDERCMQVTGLGFERAALIETRPMISASWRNAGMAATVMTGSSIAYPLPPVGLVRSPMGSPTSDVLGRVPMASPLPLTGKGMSVDAAEKIKSTMQSDWSGSRQKLLAKTMHPSSEISSLQQQTWQSMIQVRSMPSLPGSPPPKEKPSHLLKRSFTSAPANKANLVIQGSPPPPL